jgi:hypothetical protein
MEIIIAATNGGWVSSPSASLFLFLLLSSLSSPQDRKRNACKKTKKNNIRSEGHPRSKLVRLFGLVWFGLTIVAELVRISG